MPRIPTNQDGDPVALIRITNNGHGSADLYSNVVGFSADGSSGGSLPLSYHWDVSDDSGPNEGVYDVRDFVHEFSNTGDRTVVLTVTDNVGRQDTSYLRLVWD